MLACLLITYRVRSEIKNTKNRSILHGRSGFTNNYDYCNLEFIPELLQQVLQSLLPLRVPRLLLLREQLPSWKNDVCALPS